MCARAVDLATRAITLPRTAAQFSFQMRPLEKQLSARLGDFCGAARSRNFAAIEFVTARVGLTRDCVEISRDASEREFLLLKSLQLGMTRVAARFAAQNFLREQSFTPNRDERFRIQISWMNRPEPHR